MKTAIMTATLAASLLSGCQTSTPPTASTLIPDGHTIPHEGITPPTPSEPWNSSLPQRIPTLSTPPKYPLQSANRYTDYKPQPPSRVRDDVLRCTSNKSFISLTLNVISRNGASKNFETITGQDGLTCGIKDFATDSGLQTLFKAFHDAAPDKFAAAFGDHVNDVLSLAWLKSNNAGGKGANANDAGLVRLDWLRKGLDQLLTDPALRSVQLAAYRKQTVEPCLTVFNDKGFKLEFSLATMVGIANSRGVGGMTTALNTALQSVGGSGEQREQAAIKQLLEGYVGADPNGHGADSKLLATGFGGTPPAQLSDHGLGHRGSRAFELFTQFPYTNKTPFTGLGDFARP